MNLPCGPLDEARVAEHLSPLFSRVLGRNEIYLANHSLGRPLDQVAADVLEAVNLWADDLDGAWDAWLRESALFESQLKLVLNWPGAVVPKSSVGQGLRAVLNSFENSPVRVVATDGEFDSVDFILRAYAEKGKVEVHWVPPAVLSPVPIYRGEDILAAIGPGTDLVIVSLVQFSTGQKMDRVNEIIGRAHEVGAIVFLDSYHAAGVFTFHHQDADFIAGGCYKYLRGGTGACFLGVSPAMLNRTTLDTGWFAKKDTFSYRRDQGATREEGSRSWWESTPAILPMYQARAGLQFTLDVGIDRIREYGLRQLRSLRKVLTPHGAYIPEDPDQWGGFALLPHPDASGVVHELKSRGVNVDARAGFVRFGPDLLNTEREFERAEAILGDCLREASVV